MAKVRLKAEHLNMAEASYLRVLWELACWATDRFGPTFLFDTSRVQVWNVLQTEGLARFRSMPGLMSNEQWRRLLNVVGTPGLIRRLYQEHNATDFNREYGRQLLMALLR